MGSLKEVLEVPEVSSTDSIPSGFCSQKLWVLIYLALEPGAGEPGVGLGLLTPEISLLIFIHHILAWDQTVPHFCSSNQSQCDFFFNSILIELPFSSISDSSEVVL